MKGRTIPLATVALAGVVATGVVTTWRLASAVGPDVNNDGFVSIGDISQVVRSFGQSVSPTSVAIYVVESGVGFETEAQCDPGDQAAGGGWRRPNPSNAVQIAESYPVPGGWHVTNDFGTTKTIGVCIDNPPLRP